MLFAVSDSVIIAQMIVGLLTTAAFPAALVWFNRAQARKDAKQAEEAARQKKLDDLEAARQKAIDEQAAKIAQQESEARIKLAQDRLIAEFARNVQEVKVAVVESGHQAVTAAASAAGELLETGKATTTAVAQVATTLERATTNTTQKLDALGKVGTETTEALKVIHTAVNSTLTAAVEKEAAAMRLAYLALKQVYEMRPDGPQKEEDRKLMEAAKKAADDSAGAVRAKADSLKSGTDAEAAKQQKKE